MATAAAASADAIVYTQQTEAAEKISQQSDYGTAAINNGIKYLSLGESFVTSKQLSLRMACCYGGYGGGWVRTLVL